MDYHLFPFIVRFQSNSSHCFAKNCLYGITCPPVYLTSGGAIVQNLQSYFNIYVCLPLWWLHPIPSHHASHSYQKKSQIKVNWYVLKLKHSWAKLSYIHYVIRQSEGKLSIIIFTSVIHHLPKQLYSLAYLNCTQKLGTLQSTTHFIFWAKHGKIFSLSPLSKIDFIFSYPKKTGP